MFSINAGFLPQGQPFLISVISSSVGEVSSCKSAKTSVEVKTDYRINNLAEEFRRIGIRSFKPVTSRILASGKAMPFFADYRIRHKTFSQLA